MLALKDQGWISLWLFEKSEGKDPISKPTKRLPNDTEGSPMARGVREYWEN
jgi:hypothetical protein